MVRKFIRWLLFSDKEKELLKDSLYWLLDRGSQWLDKDEEEIVYKLLEELPKNE